jgi:nucleoside-diphosphate-sugar epimerase
MPEPKLIAIAGASGLAGSHITRKALARGYRVNGTMRDAAAPTKAPYLTALPGAADRLRLFSADMADEATFTEPFEGADCVYIACLIPVYAGPTGKPAREMDDAEGYADIIMPTVDGCLNIMGTAISQGVKTIVICSSTSSTNPIPSVPLKNEIDHWSDATEQCRAKKYTSATKTVMEKAAMQLAEEHDVRLCILLPTDMYGPVILPEQMQGNPQVWLKRVIDGGDARHQQVPNDSTSMIHLHDLADLFLAAYENPKASGRYFGVYGSWHWQDLYTELQKILPDMKMPAPMEGSPVAPTGFDTTRRDSLGVKVRDIPTLLRDTVEWLKTQPFGA